MCSHKVRTRLFRWKHAATLLLSLLRNSWFKDFSRTKQHQTRLPLENTLKSSPGGPACAAQTVQEWRNCAAEPRGRHEQGRSKVAATLLPSSRGFTPASESKEPKQRKSPQTLIMITVIPVVASTPTHFSRWIRPRDWSPRMSLRSTGCLEWGAACKQLDASRIGISEGGGGGSDRGWVGGWAVTSRPRLQMDHTRVNPQSKCPYRRSRWATAP